MFLPSSPQVLLALWAGLTAGPSVKLDDATVVGKTVGSSNQFLGIPYARPPVDELRFNLPQSIEPYTGELDATSFGPSCPQQKVILPPGLDTRLREDISKTIFGQDFPDSEDCQYDGTTIVSRSVDLKSPVIYVSMNYRLSGFGFLASKEVGDAGVGNLGLHDQRLALQWVQTYITEFGGDPSKVTIWGESSGGISVALHMLANDGDNQGLFRAAFMQSGGPIPVAGLEKGQKDYDALVSLTGCSDSSDTLSCLRDVPYASLKAAIDQSPGIFSYQSGAHLTWIPRQDNVLLKEPPQYGVLRGHVANVPFITGNSDDEGTLLTLSTTNISTTADLKSYIAGVLLPEAKSEALDLLLKYYPDDQRAGSPFDTGLKNALSAQFKRLAAINGDVLFQGPRRLFMNDLKDYLIRFAVNLDPNGRQGLGIPWPQYNSQKPQLLVLQESTLFPLVLSSDNFRMDSLNFVANMEATSYVR
ncbi:hypothetical protein H0H87_008012 [Tephrocybe sp. NHM501043]|nr:hypothetical protein H0H87_008012 [Tephrocybe sp. NHM501043]